MYYDDTQSSHVLSTPTDIFELPDELKFTPVLRPIEHSGSSISTSLGQKIVNENTDEVLGIVKSRYNPRPYNDLWEPLVEGLKMSNLDLSNARLGFKL